MILFNSQPRNRHGFNRDQHLRAVEHLRRNPCLYNRRESDYEETDEAKQALIQQVADDLNVTKKRFTTWYGTMRSEVGRTKRKVVEEGLKEEEMTVLQRRRWQEFEFMREVITFRKRVVRVR